jgi:NAD(P)-dependent dehydrogenase (short-subunit alcohol dehydrogenase family)
MSASTTHATDTERQFPEGAAIVAGGSGGLGSAACEALARQGSDVAVLYFNRDAAAAAVVDRLQLLGVQAQAWKLDLCDSAQCVSTLAAVAERFGRIHTAIYAAGPAITINYLSRIPPEEFNRVLQADVQACFNFVHAALPHVRKNGGAMIGVTTEQLDRVDLRGGLSSVPKAAVDKMFQVIAKEEARFGVRAATLRAGWVDVGLGTEALSSKMSEEARKALFSSIALGRMGQPYEIGESIAFLASRRGGYITGVSLTVNGGHHL